MNQFIKKGTHPCQDCQQNEEGKTIHGKYFSRGWITDFDPNAVGLHRCWNCWEKYLQVKINEYKSWMVKKIKAYQEALQKCQRKELWFLKEDESVYGARESTYSPSDVCENCNLYSAQGKYEDYGDIAPHVCHKCEGCRQYWQVQIDPNDNSDLRAKNEEEAIKRMREDIQDHLKGEWLPQHHPEKCKEAYEKGLAKIHVYHEDGSLTVLPANSKDNSRERERANSAVYAERGDYSYQFGE